jgi:pimeloyl-ACP methyl ester carboxylesterase
MKSIQLLETLEEVDYGRRDFISVVTMSLAAAKLDGAPHPDGAAYAGKFPGKYAHRVITGGIGHNLPQEAPQAFTQAVIDVGSY